jgi:anti-sigma B factor antagonist
MLSFVEHQHGDVTELAVQGQLTIEAEGQMAAKSAELTAAGRTRVVLDLAGLRYIDSSGIGVLVSWFKRVREMQGDVKIANLGAQPREIFRLLRFDRAFELFDSTEAARRAFAGAGPPG